MIWDTALVVGIIALASLIAIGVVVNIIVNSAATQIRRSIVAQRDAIALRVERLGEISDERLAELSQDTVEAVVNEIALLKTAVSFIALDVVALAPKAPEAPVAVSATKAPAKAPAKRAPAKAAAAPPGRRKAAPK